MPNENDKCPKCGSVASTNHAAFIEFECDSTLWSNALAEQCQYIEQFEQSDRCKITTIEAENAKLMEENAETLELLRRLNLLCNGSTDPYALADVRNFFNRRASALLEKKGTKE